jgi:phosphopantothenate--cysteine ligase
MKIIITAGGTSEPIDKVRKITNMSKGTLGAHVAFLAMNDPRIETIYFLSPQAPVQIYEGYTGKIKHIETNSTQNVLDTMQRLLTTEKIDAVIHAMAVSDYTVDFVYTLEDIAAGVMNFLAENEDFRYESDVLEYLKRGDFRLDNSSKISSKSSDLCIKLKPTPKIISQIKAWSPDTKLIGFKLLEDVSDDQLIAVGLALKEKNGCDAVYANDIKRIRKDGHQGLLITSETEIEPLVGLDQIANAILRKGLG